MTTPIRLQSVGIQFNKDDLTETISITPSDGFKIVYDIGSGNQKTFKIDKNGVSFIDNTNNFITALARLSAIQEAFQAVELPVVANTLQLNNRIYINNQPIDNSYIEIDANNKIITISDGVSTSATIQPNQINVPSINTDIIGASTGTTINFYNDIDTGANNYIKTDKIVSSQSGQVDFFSTISLNGKNIKAVDNIDLNTINGMSPTTIGLTWSDFDPNNAWSNLPSNQYGLNTYSGNSSFWQVNQFSIIDSNAGYSTYQNPSNFQISDGNNGYNAYLTLYGGAGSNTIALDTAQGNAIIGDVNGNQNKTFLLINDTHKEIDLNCVDLFVNKAGSSNMVITPTYTNLWGGNISYGGGNSWQIANSNVMYVPNDLIAETNGRYDWKMEFAINCWGMNNQDDKARAFYIEILDNASNVAQGFSFNYNIPYTVHKNTSTYSQTSSNSENYEWVDYYNFNNFTSTPLTINLYINGDSNLNCDFKWNLHLTKTNVV